jgi:putative endonuclease
MRQTSAARLGELGERLALRHYERLGYALVERNWRCAAGEIDLVVADRALTVFAEVKTRRAGGLDPLLALTRQKRRRMRTLAVAWLREHPRRPGARAVRIDAVAVVLDARDRLVALEQYEDVA